MIGSGRLGRWNTALSQIMTWSSSSVCRCFVTNDDKMIEDIGKEIVCPECKERGKVVFERVNVKGKPYYYLSVRHTLGHGRSKRCLIRRLREDEVAKLMVTKPLRVAKPQLKGLLSLQNP